MPVTRQQKGAAIFLALAGLGITVIALLLLSFSSIEYFEYGFKRQRSGGTVYTDTVYTEGRYFLGPDQDFLIYRADAHHVTLDQIDVFTRDKLEVEITVHFQYFLRKDELVQLHREFNVYYEEVVTSSAIDAIKGAVPVYTTRELISNRTSVETDLYQAVRQRIGGVCCRPDCNQYLEACPDNCMTNGTCEDKDRGLHADVIHFQLTTISIPGDVKNRFIEALVLQETTLRAKLIQEANIIRKETQALVREIQNEAEEVTQNATARAMLTKTVASADYGRIIENSRVSGLQNFFIHLNISEEKHKLSYDYLKSLMSSSNARITVGFDQRIAGSFDGHL